MSWLLLLRCHIRYMRLACERISVHYCWSSVIWFFYFMEWEFEQAIWQQQQSFTSKISETIAPRKLTLASQLFPLKLHGWNLTAVTDLTALSVSLLCLFGVDIPEKIQ